MAEHRLPGDIERSSMAIIRKEIKDRGAALEEQNAPVILRVIHATADFEYLETLTFSPDAVRLASGALTKGTPIVTDTNMALSGVSRPGLCKLGGEAFCFMADPAIAQKAKRDSTTRAAAAMRHASETLPGAILAVGNAPTALFQIAEEIEAGLRPALVVAVPVGFVNVVESKERIVSVCRAHDVPVIAAMGRKGGSSVAAAILNALIYSAADLLDPAARGWN